MLGEVLIAVVLPPGDFVVALRGPQDIDVAVYIHVGGIDGLCLFALEAGVYRVLGEILAAVVFPPGDFVVSLAGADDVYVAINVEVDGVRGLRPFAVGVYRALGEVLLAVVFPPGDFVAACGSTQNIHV